MLFGIERTHYARGKDMPSEAITSAMQIVADRETPTRQCTRVAVSSVFPVAEDFGQCFIHNQGAVNKKDLTNKV